MRILLVDDEQALRELLAQLCEREGHTVASAGSAAEALAHLRDGWFDLLITDIVMPGLDGLALVKRAKAMQSDIMAIVITGHGGKYTLEEVIEAGATDMLLKPFRAPELKIRLRLAADQRRLLEQMKVRERELQSANAAVIDGLKRELGEARQVAARLNAVVSRGERLV